MRPQWGTVTMRRRVSAAAAAITITLSLPGASQPNDRAAQAAAASPVPTVTVAPPSRKPELPRLPAGTRVRLRFAPPLDRPLTYYHSDETLAQRMMLRFTGTLTVRFTRAGESYRMEVRPRIIGAGPAMVRVPEIQQLLQPLVLRLDGSGKIIGVEGGEQYWQRTEELLLRIAKRPGVSALDVGRARVLLLTIRPVPPGARAAALAAKLSPATSLARLDMAVGDTAQAPPDETLLPFPMARPRLARRYAISLTEATAATARVEMVAQFEDGAAAAAGADVAAFLNHPGGGMRLSQTIRQQANRDSGLTRRYSERTAVEDGSGATVAIHTVHLDLVEVE